MPALRAIDRWFIDEVLPFEQRYLSAALRLLGNPEDARELVQEAYARLFTIDGWAAIESPSGYVLRTIRNIAIERIRRAKVVSFQQMSDVEAYDVADEAPDPFRAAAGRYDLRRLATAVQALPEKCRIVVLRRRFGGETPREIADSTGQSLSTLEKRLARGMQLLAAALAYGSEEGAPNPRQVSGSDKDEAVGN